MILSDFIKLVREEAEKDNEYIEITVYVTLPCKCCTDTYYFSMESCAVIKSTDAEILTELEDQCCFYTNHIKWYCVGNTSLSIEL